MNLRVPEYRCGLELATATRQQREGTGEHCRPSKGRVTELDITSLAGEPTCHLHPSFEGHSIAGKRTTVARKRGRVGDRMTSTAPLNWVLWKVSAPVPQPRSSRRPGMSRRG